MSKPKKPDSPAAHASKAWDHPGKRERTPKPAAPEPQKETVWVKRPDRPIWVVVCLHRTADTFDDGACQIVGGWDSPTQAETYARGRCCSEWSLVYTVLDRGAGDLVPGHVHEYLVGKRLPNDDEMTAMARDYLIQRVERTAIAARAYLDQCG